MEPAVKAVLQVDPDFPSTSVDIVACSSTLGNLLRFIRGEDKPFKILLESIGGTVFLERKEKSPTELIPDVRGFGHTFPEAYTSWDPDAKGSTAHQRIIKYTFDGFQCLLRFGVDGYLRGDCPTPRKQENSPINASMSPVGEEVASELASSTIWGLAYVAKSSLDVVAGGGLLPQSALLELKTRSFRKKDQDTVAEELPRLWLTQISNFILAYHTQGLFDDVQQIDVRQRTQQWESENQDLLRKFSKLLNEIVVLAKTTTADRLELRWLESGILEVRVASLEVGQTLSAATHARWRNQREDSSSESEASPYVGDEDHSVSYSEDEESEKDFTACSADDCGYCGHCSY